MCKKTLKAFVTTIFAFMFAMTLTNADCRTTDGTHESTPDVFNKKEASKRTKADVNQELICNYEPYVSMTNQTNHIEIYRANAAKTSEYDIYEYYVYKVIDKKVDHGSAGIVDEKEYQMMLCYQPKYDGVGHSDVYFANVLNCDIEDEDCRYFYYDDGLDLTSTNSSGKFGPFSDKKCSMYAGIKSATTYGSQPFSAFYYSAIVPDKTDALTGQCFGVKNGWSCQDAITKDGNIVKKNPSEFYGKDDKKQTYEIKKESYEKNLCNMAATLKTVRVVSIILNIARYVAVLLLIIFCTVDVFNVMINDGDFKKKQKSLLIRVGFAMLIFFVPIIINSIVHLADKTDPSKNSVHPFHYCSVCFFKDSHNSYAECESKIESLTGKKVKDNYASSSKIKECSDNSLNGFDDDLKNACPNGNANCSIEWHKQHSSEDYYKECMCADDSTNGFASALNKTCGSYEGLPDSTPYNECYKGFISNTPRSYYVDKCKKNVK